MAKQLHKKFTDSQVKELIEQQHRVRPQHLTVFVLSF